MKKKINVEIHSCIRICIEQEKLNEESVKFCTDYIIQAVELLLFSISSLKTRIWNGKLHYGARKIAKMLTVYYKHQQKNGCATVNYVACEHIFIGDVYSDVCFDCNYAEIMQCRLVCLYVSLSPCVCIYVGHSCTIYIRHKSCRSVVRSRFSVLGKWKLQSIHRDRRVSILVNSTAMQFHLNHCITSKCLLIFSVSR